MNNTANKKAKATFVPLGERTQWLNAVFGVTGTRLLTNAIYDEMIRLSGRDFPGRWDMYMIADNAFFVAPCKESNPEQIQICVRTNHFDEILSLKTAGIVATLFGLGRALATEPADDLAHALNKCYESLRDYCGEIEDSALIFRAID